MRRIKLTIAYDGTAYSGWQAQEGCATVEETVADAIGRLTGVKPELTGASRTDAGVHALGNVATFDTESPIPGDRFAYAINAFLPDDIRIMESEEVDLTFHPRFDAHRKRYEYHIVTANVCSPLESRYAAHIRGELDIDAMQKMAGYAVGTHDYTSFCAAGAQVKSKVRTITSLSVGKTEGGIVIAVEGDGFLYNMVRILAGTLIQAGLHRFAPEQMQTILEGRDRSLAGPTAPANGLRLCRIWYDEAGKGEKEE